MDPSNFHNEKSAWNFPRPFNRRIDYREDLLRPGSPLLIADPKLTVGGMVAGRGGEGRVVMLEMGAIPFRVLNKTSDRVLGRGGKDDDGASVKWGIK